VTIGIKGLHSRIEGWYLVKAGGAELARGGVAFTHSGEMIGRCKEGGKGSVGKLGLGWGFPAR